MAKLWQKEYTLDTLMEEFTVGNDYLLDKNLVASDCIASIAHAKGLLKVGLLTESELESLEAAIKGILEMNGEGKFALSMQDEDCHTAIEAYLTSQTGDAGKKIHTGRSRNDQVQTALRLWMREFIVRMAAETAELAKALLAFAQEHEWVPMPGRTHMQLAMPSSVGLWAGSFAEELYDEANNLLRMSWIIDQSPLGSAASYGTSLPLDRAYSAGLMGFSRVQNNVLYANNSRGKFEAMVLDQCDYITLTLSKLAQDMILFSLPEFGYFTLPKELCTGSSIMPQKRNPDGLELTRSRSAVVSSCSERVKSIIRSLPSGYNRDFQDTKEPLMTGTKTALTSVRVMKLMIDRLVVHPDKLTAGCKSELYATDEVLKRLSQGGSFRDVYKEVGMSLDSVSTYDAVRTIQERTSQGTTGNLGLANCMAEVENLYARCTDSLQSLEKTYMNLCHMPVVLVAW
jgi:argininosuccinate lyase